MRGAVVAIRQRGALAGLALAGRRATTGNAAVGFVEEQIEAGAFDGGVARCRATTRKGKACQRTPLPDRDYCPSHQHLERSKAAA